MIDLDDDLLLYTSNQAFNEDDIVKDFPTVKEHSIESPYLTNQIAKCIYLLENSPLGIFLTELDGNIKWTNKQASIISGYDQSELINQNMRILKSEHHNSNFYKEMWRQIRENGYWQGEIWNRKKGGELYFQWMRVSAFRDQNKEITEYVAVVANLSDPKFSKVHIYETLYADRLTGLGTKKKLEIDIDKAIDDPLLSRFYLLTLDIDNFSKINIRFGYTFGDYVLKEIGRRINEVLQNEGIAYRISGDLYSVLFLDISSHARFVELAKEIDLRIDEPVTINDTSVDVKTHVGVSVYPDDGMSHSELLQNTEIALQHAKISENSRIQFSSKELNSEAFYWMKMEDDLKRAIKQNEFHMEYQVLIDNPTKRIKGSEALVRWEHPEHGSIRLDQFIPYTESTGLIIPLGYLVIEQVFSDAKDYFSKYDENHYFSINISIRQFDDTCFYKKIKSLIEKYEIRENQIVFEITERTFAKNHQRVKCMFQELKDLGIRIALDDFGTGESSLSFLTEFDVDILKIDSSFISSIREDSKRRKMAKAVINFCNEISVETVVEGIETLNDVEFVSELKCNTLQGYYYGKPLRYNDFLNKVEEQAFINDVSI